MVIYKIQNILSGESGKKYQICEAKRSGSSVVYILLLYFSLILYRMIIRFVNVTNLGSFIASIVSILHSIKTCKVLTEPWGLHDQLKDCWACCLLGLSGFRGKDPCVASRSIVWRPPGGF